MEETAVGREKPADQRETCQQADQSGSWPGTQKIGSPLALDLRRPLSAVLQDFLAKPPTTGTPVDAVIRRATNEAHAASPQAVDMCLRFLLRPVREGLDD